MTKVRPAHMPVTCDGYHLRPSRRYLPTRGTFGYTLGTDVTFVHQLHIWASAHTRTLHHELTTPDGVTFDPAMDTRPGTGSECTPDCSGIHTAIGDDYYYSVYNCKGRVYSFKPQLQTAATSPIIIESDPTSGTDSSCRFHYYSFPIDSRVYYR